MTVIPSERDVAGTIERMLEKSEYQVQLYRPCPTCETQTGTTLGKLSYALPEGSPLTSEYEAVCCSNCGLVMVNTPSSQVDYDAFYTSSFYSPEFLERNLSEAEIEYFSETVAILSQGGKLKGRALYDVGCGAGYLLEALQQKGFNAVYGVDPSTACVNLLNSVKGITAELGELAALPFQERKLEMVILSHIIEHIIDIPTALSNLNLRLDDQGQVFVEVPDSRRYEQFAQGKPLSFFYLQHVLHFDMNHLKNLFSRFGFESIESGYRERIEKGFTMPAIWAIFKKREEHSNTVVPDFTLANAIHHWFKESSLDPSGELAELAASQRPVYVWGMGIHAQIMLKMSPLASCNIAMLLDKNEKLHGVNIAGKVIESSARLTEASAEDVVFITALVHGDEMIRHLRSEIGFRGKIIRL